MDAQRDIKRLAEKINKGRRSAEEAEREARVIQEIEAHIEGVEHVRILLKRNNAKQTAIAYFDVFSCMSDSESTEEVPETGNSYGSGKTHFFETFGKMS